jgi:putative ABC transport system permease protein
MNLAIRDVRHRIGRFLLTGAGLGLLMATVMAMGGIYRGLVEDALSLVRAAAGADLWVVQKDTNGPFAESSRVPEDLYRALEAAPGVAEASPVSFQSIQIQIAGRFVRVQLVGARPGALGAAPSVADGRPISRSQGEMVIDRRSNVPLGTRLLLGRNIVTVVGRTDGIVSNSGDAVAFVSLEDAQQVQFLAASEAIRNERARVAEDLAYSPDLGDGSAEAATQVSEDTHVANAVLVRLEPWANAREVAASIERWNHYRALTADEQAEVLTRSVVERARQQLLLFRIILLAVSTVVIALIVYTMTLEKTRDIATLKIIGAPDRMIGAMIVQEALALGLSGFAVGALLIQLTYDRFPRRVVLLPLDQLVLLGIVVGICLAASLLGVRRALRIDTTTAMGGGA